METGNILRRSLLWKERMHPIIRQGRDFKARNCDTRAGLGDLKEGWEWAWDRVQKVETKTTLIRWPHLRDSVTLGRKKEWQEIVLVFHPILLPAFKQERLLTLIEQALPELVALKGSRGYNWGWAIWVGWGGCGQWCWEKGECLEKQVVILYRKYVSTSLGFGFNLHALA